MRSQKCVEMDVEFRVSLYDHIEQKVIDRDVPMAKGNLGNEKKMMGRGSHVWGCEIWLLLLGGREP